MVVLDVAKEGYEGKAVATDSYSDSSLIVNQEDMALSLFIASKVVVAKKGKEGGVKNQEINSLDDVKEGIIENIKGWGLDDLSLAELSDGRRCFQKRAWGVVLEFLSKKGIRCYDYRGNDSPLCIQEGSKGEILVEKFGGPCEPMIEEGVSRKSSSKGGKKGRDKNEGVTVVSFSSSSSRRGGNNFFPSRSHCMKTRSVAQEFGLSGLEIMVAIFITKKDKFHGAWFK
ncbi:hypothetical protein QYF36_001996 [Acer negundo]|nr:hypothetical protein QYF36_001996 [Acer negundo]